MLSQDTSAYEYDAFISYKNTDTEQQRTEDSRIAVELHEHLQRGGLRVFLSEMTLAEIGSHDFRDAIDDALEKTRVLITVATRVEHLTSEWVKYEWQSFHGDMLSGDHPGGAIFSYLTFSPSRENRLPRGLRRFQVIEHGPDGPERLLRFLTTPDPAAADAPVDSEIVEELISNLPRHAAAESWRAELNLALARLNKEDWPGCIQTCVDVARRVVTSALQTLQLATSDDVGANAKRLQSSQRFPRQFFDALRDVERSKQQVHPTFSDAEAALESTTRDIAGYYIREILAPDQSAVVAKTHDPRLTQRTLIEAFRDALFESDPKKARLVLERLQELPTPADVIERLRKQLSAWVQLRAWCEQLDTGRVQNHDLLDTYYRLEYAQLRDNLDLAVKIDQIRRRLLPLEIKMSRRAARRMKVVPSGPITGYRGTDRWSFIDAFAIEKFPVTVQAYRAFLASPAATSHRFCEADEPPGKSHRPDGWAEQNRGDGLHPVTGVDWYDATAFARAAGKRLPTESEWEKAAFWDEARKQMRHYPWGDETRTGLTNSAEHAHVGTTSVQAFPGGESRYGVLDMVGNVWEWCADWQDEEWDRKYQKNGTWEPRRRRRNPKGQEHGTTRVMRGGCWSEPIAELDRTWWSRAYPEVRSSAVGFRCVQSVHNYESPPETVDASGE